MTREFEYIHVFLVICSKVVSLIRAVHSWTKLLNLYCKLIVSVLNFHSASWWIWKNRYMTEVRRLALPQSQTEAVYRGFRELEESLISPFSFELYWLPCIPCPVVFQMSFLHSGAVLALQIKTFIFHIGTSHLII